MTLSVLHLCCSPLNQGWCRRLARMIPRTLPPEKPPRAWWNSSGFLEDWWSEDDPGQGPVCRRETQRLDRLLTAAMFCLGRAFMFWHLFKWVKISSNSHATQSQQELKSNVLMMTKKVKCVANGVLCHTNIHFNEQTHLLHKRLGWLFAWRLQDLLWGCQLLRLLIDRN